MLWIALELPALPLQLVERLQACDTPFVITEGSAQRPTVACLNEPARTAGLREGMAVAAGQALAANLRWRPRDEAAEREALERLAAWAAQFTPTITVEATGLLLEVEGSQKLFGGLSRMLSALRSGIQALGLKASLGIAPTPLAARVMARASARGIAVRSCVLPSELPARLAELPVFLLDWPGQTQSLLSDLGLVRLKDVIALPKGGFTRRFGPEALDILERLTGQKPDPRPAFQPPPRYRARLELPADAEGVEALLFPLKRLLLEMEGALRGRGAGVQSLQLQLEHGSRRRSDLELAFATPEREAEFILSIAREKLARLALPAATSGLRIAANELLPYRPREGAWLPGRQEKVFGRARLLEKLAARLGQGAVFGIAMADDHRPERGWQRSAAAKPSAKVPGHRPAWLMHRPQKLIAGSRGPTLQGALSLLAGPERIETGWWDGEPVSRDYYVAANPAGETYWVYRERKDPGAWYVHGIFS